MTSVTVSKTVLYCIIKSEVVVRSVHCNEYCWRKRNGQRRQQPAAGNDDGGLRICTVAGYTPTKNEARTCPAFPFGKRYSSTLGSSVKLPPHGWPRRTGWPLDYPVRRLGLDNTGRGNSFPQEQVKNNSIDRLVEMGSNREELDGAL